MIDYSKYEVWFITGSQHLYGPETLKQIDANSRKLVAEMNRDAKLPLKLVAKPVLTTADAIESLCLEANASNKCVGLVMWMHTFSPAKMWIGGLTQLAKPFAHLHTQMNRDIPWDKIDMDFMNLNQSAHGDREFGYICTRLGKNRKVIAGHWTDGEVRRKLNVWMRAAMARQDCRGMSIARFGDNMRNVAVTEGDKVEAEIKFGYRVNGYGVGDVVEQVEKVSTSAVEDLCAEYDRMYTMSADLKPKGKRRDALRHCAKIELGMRKFLTAGNFKAFTDTFENLHGLVQLPGLAAQRLMADGYGFGAEGDWKHAALVRSFKVMGAGLTGGASFMEDYTYHLDPKCGMVLGAHMLEVCPTISRAKASCEIHPLGIGGKDDPVRLVFNADPGDALNATVVDMGNRFRMIVNTVKVVAPKKPLPKLPVARALWVPQPDLATSASAWILAGGAHHTAFSQAIGVEHVEDFAEMFDVEFVLIDKDATISGIKKELRANSAYYDGKSAK